MRHPITTKVLECFSNIAFGCNDITLHLFATTLLECSNNTSFGLIDITLHPLTTRLSEGFINTSHGFDDITLHLLATILFIYGKGAINPKNKCLIKQHGGFLIWLIN